MMRPTSCFDLFAAEVVPAHWAGVERQANIARAAVLDAVAGRVTGEYAQGCRAAHALVLREARQAFRAVWPGWAAGQLRTIAAPASCDR